MCNEYSFTEAARGFIVNTLKYISAQINHLPSFYSLLKLVRRAVNGKCTQPRSSVSHRVVSKVSSLDLSERGRREIGGKARGREEGNEMRGREHRRARGGMVRKAKLSKRKSEWIVNVRGKQSGGWGWKWKSEE